MAKAKMLVVDDDPAILKSTTLILERAGYEVIQASSGEEALKQAQITTPDLILLDVVLPGIDGLEVCRRLKSNPKTASTAIILMSGAQTASESQAQGLELGADGYIARPVSNRELIARVEAVLRLRQVDKQIQQHQQELQQLIAERTEALETFRGATVDREVRMSDLKDVIRQLRAQLEEAGITPVANDPFKEIQ